jgi:hypothetical protein
MCHDESTRIKVAQQRALHTCTRRVQLAVLLHVNHGWLTHAVRNMYIIHKNHQLCAAL